MPTATIELRALISDFQSKISQVQNEIGKTKKAAEEAGGSWDAMATAAGIAGVAIVAAGAAVADSSIKMADEYDKAHARLVVALDNTGQSWDRWSGRVKAAEVQGAAFGYNAAQIEDALSRLETATKDPAKALDLLRVAEDLAAARGIDLNSAAQLVTRAAGGTYTALLRLGIITKDQAAQFKSGADAVKYLADTYGGQAAVQADTFGGKLAALKANAQNLEITIGQQLVPALEVMVTAVTKVLGPLTSLGITPALIQGGLTGLVNAVNQASESHGRFAGVLGVVTSAISPVVSALGLASNKHNDNKRAADDAAAAAKNLGISQEELATVLGDTSNAADVQQKAIDSLQKTFLDYVNAQRGMTAATNAVDSATRNVSDAQRNLNDLLAKGAVDTKAVTDAQYALGQATRTVWESYSRLADAQANLQKVEEGATPLDKASAQERLAESSHHLSEAQIRLSDLQQSGTLDYWGLVDAQDAVNSAQLDLTRSQQDLNKVMSDGKPGSDSYKQAQDQVTSAEIALKDAQHNQQTAAENLQRATAGDPDFAQKVADAKNRLKDAENNLNDAKWRQFTAALALTDAQGKEQTAFQNAGGAISGMADQLARVAWLQPAVADVAWDVMVIANASATIASNFAYAANNVAAFARAEAAGKPEPTPVKGFYQHGGRFGAGDVMVVGEAGPELVRFGHGGSVIPNSALRPGGPVGAGVNVTVNVAGSVVTERQLTDAIRAQLLRDQRALTGLFS